MSVWVTGPDERSKCIILEFDIRVDGEGVFDAIARGYCADSTGFVGAFAMACTRC